MNTDVVIIGGGPAGTTAGTVLQKKGYSTCIIERQNFPRQKLCAGVLTFKSLQLIQHIYGKTVYDQFEINYIDKVSLFYKKTRIGNYRIRHKFGVIERKEFDAALIECYKQSGGRLYEEQRFYKIQYQKNKILLDNGEEIIYKFLIGADGINSQIRNFVQKPWKTSVFCFEGFIPNDKKENCIRIYFGDVLGGYSWRIPGTKYVGIGLGEFYIRGRKRSPFRYKSFFQEQGISNLQGVKGAFVSTGKFVKRPVKNNVLLVGDAAGLVDAMSGEGIFFAMESGRQAALAIADTYEKGKRLEQYIFGLRKIHHKIREQRVYNRLLFVPGLQLFCIGYMKKHPKFVKEVIENAMSTYHSGYGALIHKR